MRIAQTFLMNDDKKIYIIHNHLNMTKFVIFQYY